MKVRSILCSAVVQHSIILACKHQDHCPSHLSLRLTSAVQWCCMNHRRCIERLLQLSGFILSYMHYVNLCVKFDNEWCLASTCGHADTNKCNPSCCVVRRGLYLGTCKRALAFATVPMSSPNFKQSIHKLPQCSDVGTALRNTSIKVIHLLSLIHI